MIRSLSLASIVGMLQIYDFRLVNGLCYWIILEEDLNRYT